MGSKSMTINWPTLSKVETQKRYENIFKELYLQYPPINKENLPFCPKKINDHKVDTSFIALRQKMISISHEIDYNRIYKFDLKVAFILYKHFDPNEISFGLRTASDLGFWRYLSIEVLPDIIYLRRSRAISDECSKISATIKLKDDMIKELINKNKDDFWAKPLRIWLQRLWWFIHLSWQGDEQSTGQILSSRSADTILNLVERIGINGYRIDVYREMIKQTQGMSDDQFRKTMVNHTANCAILEPSLYCGGISQYVRDLIKSVQ
jgi:hypothetical protein